MLPTARTTLHIGFWYVNTQWWTRDMVCQLYERGSLRWACSMHRRQTPHSIQHCDEAVPSVPGRQLTCTERTLFKAVCDACCLLLLQQLQQLVDVLAGSQ
jgi:hypothetical protein